MGFSCVLSIRKPALKQGSLMDPRWHSRRWVELGLAAGQGTRTIPALCLPSHSHPSALGRVRSRTRVKLFPSSLCICISRITVLDGFTLRGRNFDVSALYEVTPSEACSTSCVIPMLTAPRTLRFYWGLSAM